MKVKQLATLCHQAIREFKINVMNEDMNDWNTCEQWRRDDTIQSVKMILRYDHPTYDLLHNHWLEMKRVNGWVYGKETDRPNKIHNCMVSFDELPPEEQAKDHLFVELCLIYKPFISNI